MQYIKLSPKKNMRKAMETLDFGDWKGQTAAASISLIELKPGQNMPEVEDSVIRPVLKVQSEAPVFKRQEALHLRDECDPGAPGIRCNLHEKFPRPNQLWTYIHTYTFIFQDKERNKTKNNG